MVRLMTGIDGSDIASAASWVAVWRWRSMSGSVCSLLGGGRGDRACSWITNVCCCVAADGDAVFLWVLLAVARGSTAWVLVFMGVQGVDGGERAHAGSVDADGGQDVATTPLM